MTRKRKGAAFGSDDRALWDEIARSVETPEASKPLGRAKNRAKDQSDDQSRRKGAASPAPEKTISNPKVVPDDFEKMLQGAGGGETLEQSAMFSAGRSKGSKKTISENVIPDKAIPEKDRRKIEHGQRSIDLKIDLHGLTQDEAYVRLKVALNQASADDLRRVLIVTGKGGSKSDKDGRGILARNVPEWLRSGGLSHLISGISTAAPRHGGGGALYVTLRRNRKP